MSRFLHLWLWPVVIGVTSAAGLVCALLGDGAWDWASWVALGIPVLVCLRFALRDRSR